MASFFDCYFGTMKWECLVDVINCKRMKEIELICRKRNSKHCKKKMQDTKDRREGFHKTKLTKSQKHYEVTIYIESIFNGGVLMKGIKQFVNTISIEKLNISISILFIANQFLRSNLLWLVFFISWEVLLIRLFI